jgi:cytochrome c1
MDVIGMAGARDLAFAAVADALASRQLDRIQPVAAEPHYPGQHHQHQELADNSEADADTDRDFTYNDAETDREFTHGDSVFEHSIFHEDTRTFEFEDEEEEDWVDATPSTTASSEVERHAEIRRQKCETNTSTTSTDHSVRKLHSLSMFQAQKIGSLRVYLSAVVCKDNPIVDSYVFRLFFPRKLTGLSMNGPFARLHREILIPDF